MAAATVPTSHPMVGEAPHEYDAAMKQKEESLRDFSRKYPQHDKVWWDEKEDAELVEQSRKDVLKAMAVSEARKPVSRDELFHDVYDKLPRHLQEQEEAFYRNLEKNKDKYPPM